MDLTSHLSVSVHTGRVEPAAADSLHHIMEASGQRLDIGSRRGKDAVEQVDDDAGAIAGATVRLEDRWKAAGLDRGGGQRPLSFEGPLQLAPLLRGKVRVHSVGDRDERHPVGDREQRQTDPVRSGRQLRGSRLVRQVGPEPDRQGCDAGGDESLDVVLAGPFDPAHAPGTGTPEAGGLTSRELLNTLRGLVGLNIVGADIVEVSPPYDHAEITGIAAAHVAYELLSVLARNRQDPTPVGSTIRPSHPGASRRPDMTTRTHRSTGRRRAGPPAADRVPLHRLRPAEGTARQGLAPGPVLVHRQLRADHDGHRLRRPLPGISLGWSVVAVVLGAVFGTFFMAFHANQGPRMGLPQMIQSRAQFGIRGAVVPFVAVVFVYVGFNVFNVILATQGLQPVLPGAPGCGTPILIVLAVALAVVGYDLLHFVQRWLTYLLIAVFGVLTIGALTNLDAGSAIPSSGGFSWASFLITFGAAAGYQISYAVYVSDYSRYLPQGRPGKRRDLLDLRRCRRLGGLADVAGRVPRLVDRRSRRDRQHPADRELVFPGFGTFAVVVSVPALVSIMAINFYGAMLTGASAVDGFRPVKADRPQSGHRDRRRRASSPTWSPC